MSKRKGLSLDEKRQKMIELFYEKRDFFQLKELERLAPKEKGIVAQSVKDVVQALVDDGLVDTDKIGTCVYFWAFPSKAVVNRKRKLEDLSAHVEEVERKKLATAEKVQQARIGRETSTEREELLAELKAAKEQKDLLTAEVQQFRDFDPEALSKMSAESVTARDAANRWTDNICCIKSWCKNQFGIEEADLNKNFSIPEELDYVE